MKVTVVGAGVAGLTSATALRAAGNEVAIVARDVHHDTVSSVAAAVWTVTSAQPAAAARRWALTSHARFAELGDDPATGVVAMRHHELDRYAAPSSWWETTPFVRRLHADELPPGYLGGLAIEGYLIEPSIYLDWLDERLADRGVTTEIAHVDRLDDLDGDVIVNCTGLGAAGLVGDTHLVPIRGQIVTVANPGITDGVTDESDERRITYVYPRSRDVVLGGTRIHGDQSTAADPAETRRILADTRRLDPRLADAPVTGVRVGLRPGRSHVRLDADHLDDGRRVVHNYGHGGAGYILSWGCALDVVGLVAE